MGNSSSAVETSIDVAAILEAVIWPALLFALLLLYREQVVAAFTTLGARMTSVSVGGVVLELSDARRLSDDHDRARVDLRKAGFSSDINDSTLREFFEQLRDPRSLDYAIVDLGSGEEWLTSRLYILSTVLRRMRGLEVLVFLEDAGSTRRRFLGWCRCEHVRWQLAAQFPWFEAARAHAELETWAAMRNRPAPGDAPFGADLGAAVAQSGVRVVDDRGRIEQWGSPQPAANLLSAFLDAVQSTDAKQIAADEEGAWSLLPADPHIVPPAPARWEHASWLTGATLERLLGETLIRESVRTSSLAGKSDLEKSAIALDREASWLALVHDDGSFDRLIDMRRAHGR